MPAITGAVAVRAGRLAVRSSFLAVIMTGSSFLVPSNKYASLSIKMSEKSFHDFIVTLFGQSRKNKEIKKTKNNLRKKYHSL